VLQSGLVDELIARGVSLLYQLLLAAQQASLYDCGHWSDLQPSDSLFTVSWVVDVIRQQDPQHLVCDVLSQLNNRIAIVKGQKSHDTCYSASYMSMWPEVSK